MPDSQGFKMEMLDPYSAAKEHALQKIDMQGVLDSISMSVQTIVDNSEAASKIVTSSGETPAMVMQSDLGALEAKRETQKAAAAADSSRLAVDLSTNLKSLIDRQNKLSQEYTQYANDDSSFTSRLMGALAKPVLEQEIKQVNGLIASTSAASTALNNHITAAGQTAALVAETVTEQQIIERHDALAANSAIKAAQYRQDAGKTRLEGIKAAAGMTQQGLGIWQTKQQADQAAAASARAGRAELRDIARFDMEQKRFEQSITHEANVDRRAAAAEARAEKIFAAQVAHEERMAKLSAAKLKEDQEAEDAGQRMLETANAGAELSGAKKLTSVAEFNNMSKFAPEVLKAWLSLGSRAAINKQAGIDANSTVFGATLESRLDTIESSGVLGPTPQSQQLISMQKRAVEDAVIANPTGNKAIHSATANKLFDKTFDDGQNMVTEGSVFEAPAYSAMTEVAKLNPTHVANSAGWKKYVEPLYAADPSLALKPVNSQQVFSSLLNGVKNRELTTAQAGELYSQIFKQAIDVNNAVHKTVAFTGRTQTRYGVRVKGRDLQLKQFNAVNSVEATAAFGQALTQEMVGYPSGPFAR